MPEIRSYRNAFIFYVPSKRELTGFAPFLFVVNKSGKQLIIAVQHFRSGIQNGLAKRSGFFVEDNDQVVV